MRISRLYLAMPLVSGTSFALEKEHAHYLTRVLRLPDGAEILLFNGDGHDYHATLKISGRHAVSVETKAQCPQTLKPLLEIELILGVSRGNRMDFALQKAVELGVTRIVPVVTQRSQISLEALQKSQRSVHWQGVISAACEQSGRNYLPELAPCTSFEQWLSHPSELGLLLMPENGRRLRDLPQPTEMVSLLVGPEGGLNSQECQQAIAEEWQPIQLGPRILRTETAPLAAISAIQTLWGDF